MANTKAQMQTSSSRMYPKQKKMHFSFLSFSFSDCYYLLTQREIDSTMYYPGIFL